MNNKKVLTLTLAGLMSSFALVGCNKGPSLAETVASKLTVDSSYKQPTAGFLVPNVVLHEGTKYNVTWSEESDFVEIGQWDESFSKVAITRPAKGEANANYDLVGTIEADGKKATKTFSGVIPAYLEAVPTYTKVTDIYSALGDKTIKVNDTIEFTGIVSNVNAAGLYVTGSDAESIFIYGADPAILKGDKVKVSGPMATYHSMYQFGKGTAIEALSRNNEASLKAYKADPVTVAEIYDLDPQLGNPIHGQTMKMTGVLSVETSGSYTNYYLRDLENSSKKHQIYYKTTSKELGEKFTAESGKKVTYDVIYYTNDKKGQAYVIYNDNEETLPAGTALTAAEQFNYDVTSYKPASTIAGNLPVEVTLNGNKYDAKYNGLAEDDSVVIAADGKVKMPADPITLKTFEVTFTSKDGANTKKLSFNGIKVGISEYAKLADVYKNKKADEVYVKAEVIANPSNGDFIVVQDGLPYYVRGFDLKVGTIATMSGKYKLFDGGLHQFSVTDILGATPVETPTKIDTSKAIAVDLTGLGAAFGSGLTAEESYKNEVIAKVLANELKLVKLEGKMGKQFTEFEGCQINTNKDMIKAAGIVEGDKIISYAIITGPKVKNGKANKVQGYTVAIEKVVEEPAA